MAKKTIKIAIAYDFDGTLAPGNMQEHSFIPKLGINSKQFWNEVKMQAKSNDMNEILAYMQLMLKKAKEKDIKITKEAFLKHGRGISYFPGVEVFFEKINAYAKSKNAHIDHFIISSGLRDILNGTPIKKHFKTIFASGYKFDANGVAEWPALAIDYTSKTQYLFRINKGIENAWDNTEINKFCKYEERPMPFENMIYLGDGETDVPAMKMIKYQGGTAVAVYNPSSRKQKGKKSPKDICEELIIQNRADYIAAADYTAGSRLFRILQLTIDKITATNELKSYSA